MDNPFVKPVSPLVDSPRVRLLGELRERPGQTMAQLAEKLGVVYSTVRSSLRTLRNDGKVRQQASHKKANAKWELGRDDAYLARMGIDSTPEPTPFVAFRDELTAALFGNPKQQPEGESNV